MLLAAALVAVSSDAVSSIFNQQQHMREGLRSGCCRCCASFPWLWCCWLWWERGEEEEVIMMVVGLGLWGGWGLRRKEGWWWWWCGHNDGDREHSRGTWWFLALKQRQKRFKDFVHSLYLSLSLYQSLTWWRVDPFMKPRVVPEGYHHLLQ